MAILYKRSGTQYPITYFRIEFGHPIPENLKKYPIQSGKTRSDQIWVLDTRKKCPPLLRSIKTVQEFGREITNNISHK